MPSLASPGVRRYTSRYCSTLSPYLQNDNTSTSQHDQFNGLSAEQGNVPASFNERQGNVQQKTSFAARRQGQQSVEESRCELVDGRRRGHYGCFGSACEWSWHRYEGSRIRTLSGTSLEPAEGVPKSKVRVLSSSLVAVRGAPPANLVSSLASHLGTTQFIPV
jgi:hypothetical protein